MKLLSYEIVAKTEVNDIRGSMCLYSLVVDLDKPEVKHCDFVI